MRPESHATILLIDDDLVLSEPLIAALCEKGYVVTNATDGQEGLQVALRDHPDLILLDILMPVMDGLSMLRSLRAEGPWGQSVPVILLTNLSPDEQRIMEAIARDGPSYYLVKSDWKLHEVVSKVEASLTTQRRSTQGKPR